TILALVSGQTSDQEGLFVASDLARRFEAEARVVPSAPNPAEVALSYDWLGASVMSAEFNAALETTRVQIAAAVETATRQAAEAAQIPFGATKAGACATLAEPAVAPWLTLLNEAPFADLCVIARKAAAGPAALSTIFADALMDLRLPILIANGARPACGGTAVLAWNGSMEAGRAMRAAMPLLLSADRVVVAQHKARIEWDEADAAALQRCADYLHRHGVGKLESLQIEVEVDREALLQAVKDAGADLLVAGAYGHPRWQEFLFGGFTRALFEDEDEDAPHVLVSH
ncbi:MAG: universal stress protein, partial [Phenylobacterium sp.]